MHAIDSLSTKFPTALITGLKVGWRHRAKLAVRGTRLSPKIGLFKPGTHEVEDLVDCSDHHPSINKALSVIRSFSFEPYNETTLTGALRYVQLTVERSTGLVQLVLVSNGLGACSELAAKLAKAHNFHSIWTNNQVGSTNTIFGPNWDHLFGPKYLKQNFLGTDLYFHPACFIQAHLELFEEIVKAIKSQILPHKHVTELYAGVGAIGLNLASRCQSLALVEANPFAKECFLQSGPPPHLSFHTGLAESFFHLFQDVLIVDPPRKGLDRATLEAIEHSPLQQIIYLSCSIDTLKRDLEQLKKAGWALVDAKGYHLFPNTDHVEILADLRKSG